MSAAATARRYSPTVRSNMDAALLRGGSDKSIARSLGVSRTCVRRRRMALKLPVFVVGPSPLTPEKLAQIDAAIHAGGYDKVIARTLGVGLHRVRCRRAELGVPFFRPGDNGRLQGVPTPHRCNPRPENWEAKLRAGFKRGESNAVLAERLHMCSTRIGRLRAEWGFPMFDRRKRADANASYAGRDPLYARINAALARADASIKEDAAQEMYVAVLTGELREADIERLASRFSGRQLSTYADRWGALSIDEMRGEDEGFNLHSVIPDAAAAAAMDAALIRGLWGPEVLA